MVNRVRRGRSSLLRNFSVWRIGEKDLHLSLGDDGTIPGTFTELPEVMEQAGLNDADRGLIQRVFWHPDRCRHQS